MSDLGLTNPQETLLGHPVRSATSGPRVAGRSGGAGAAPPPPPPSLPEWSASPSMSERARPPRVRRVLANRRSGRIAAAALMCAAIGLPVSLAASPSATAAQLVAASASGTGASNARSAPAQGGASGTVASVSKSGFTMTTSAGQKVTVDEKSSTTYDKGTSFDLGQGRYQGPKRPRTGYGQLDDHHSHSGRRWLQVGCERESDDKRGPL